MDPPKDHPSPKAWAARRDRGNTAEDRKAVPPAPRLASTVLIHTKLSRRTKSRNPQRAVQYQALTDPHGPGRPEQRGPDLWGCSAAPAPATSSRASGGGLGVSREGEGKAGSRHKGASEPGPRDLKSLSQCGSDSASIWHVPTVGVRQQGPHQTDCGRVPDGEAGTHESSLARWSAPVVSSASHGRAREEWCSQITSRPRESRRAASGPIQNRVCLQGPFSHRCKVPGVALPRARPCVALQPSHPCSGQQYL